jgi:hypothetical protein
VVTVYAVGDKPKGDHTIQTTLTEVEYSGRIRGNTVGTTTPRTDFNQTDPTKADYLKGREKIVQTVNGAAPDENGNVVIDIPEPTVEIQLDKTLSKDGMAADAAAVGEALSKVGKPSGEEIATAVADYLKNNPIETTSNWDTLENKPFYEEIVPEVLREYTALDGFAPNPDFGGLYSGFENPAGFEIILGDTYVVMWDGIAYECVALDMSAVSPGAVGLGNAVVVGGEPTTEPFAIGLIDGMAVYIDVDTQNPKTSHEIGIYHNCVEIKKLDEKFLPDCAATKEYVQQYLEEYIEDALGGDY